MRFGNGNRLWCWSRDRCPRRVRSRAMAQHGARIGSSSPSWHQTRCAPISDEASMKLALSNACDVASDRAAPRRASLRSSGNRYAERVWSMQAFGVVGRMIHRSTLHRRPNPALERTAERRRRSVPVARCAPAAAQLCRSAAREAPWLLRPSGCMAQSEPRGCAV